MTMKTDRLMEFKAFLDSRGRGGEWDDDVLSRTLKVVEKHGKYSEDVDAAPGRMMIKEDKWMEVWHDEDVDGNKYKQFGIAVGRKDQQSLLQLPSADMIRPVGVKSLDQHKFSSTQFNLADAGYNRSQGSPIPRIQELVNGIDDADLAEDGKEDRFHVTVKYGLHTDDPEEVWEVVREWLESRQSVSVDAILGKVSVFSASEKHQYDVVKLEVESEDLRQLNRFLCDRLEHTDTHPVYNPHLTLAYVKPGMGKKYEGDGLGRHQVLFHKLLFSDQSKTKHTMDFWEVCRNETEIKGLPSADVIRPQVQSVWVKSREHEGEPCQQGWTQTRTGCTPKEDSGKNKLEETSQSEVPSGYEVVYHGTSVELIDAILKNGLKANKPDISNWALNYEGEVPKGVYGALDARVAAEWTLYKAEQALGDEIPLGEARLCIFQIRIPREVLKSDPMMKGARYYPEDIPPDWIVGVAKNVGFLPEREKGRPVPTNLIWEKPDREVLEKSFSETKTGEFYVGFLVSGKHKISEKKSFENRFLSADMIRPRVKQNIFGADQNGKPKPPSISPLAPVSEPIPYTKDRQLPGDRVNENLLGVNTAKVPLTESVLMRTKACCEECERGEQCKCEKALPMNKVETPYDQQSPTDVGPNETIGYDALGGIVPINLSAAKRVDLVTLPDDVAGANCGNCKKWIVPWEVNGFCSHPEVQMEVSRSQCCARWEHPDMIRAWETASHTENNGELKTKALCPAVFLGWQKRPGDTPLAFYNLTQDLGDHPAGSTVTAQTLRKYGCEPPTPPPYTEGKAMSWMDTSRGAALVKPPALGRKPVGLNRNGRSIVDVKSLRLKYRSKALEDEKESLIADILGGLAGEDVLTEVLEE